MITEEEFKAIADAANDAVRQAAVDALQPFFVDDNLNGARLFAMMAGMASATGYALGTFEIQCNTFMHSNKMKKALHEQMDPSHKDGRRANSH